MTGRLHLDSEAARRHAEQINRSGLAMARRALARSRRDPDLASIGDHARATTALGNVIRMHGRRR